MQRYEYKVVPAPNRTKRVRGVKTPAGRFAVVMTELINEEAAQGWEYLRTDSMPVEEKPGFLKRRVENYYSVLVFRRAMDQGAAEDFVAHAPEVAAVPAAPVVAAPLVAAAAAPDYPQDPVLAPPVDPAADAYPAEPPMQAGVPAEPEYAPEPEPVYPAETPAEPYHEPEPVHEDAVQHPEESYYPEPAAQEDRVGDSPFSQPTEDSPFAEPSDQEDNIFR
ncbi:MAG: hypothetical protein AAF393_19065 [Pseudomonadota bacterium]